MSDRIEIHASPTGSVYGDGSAGYPVADLQAAVRLIRQRRSPGQRAVVWLAGGRYAQRRTLELSPADSFLSFRASDPDDLPIIDGGAPVTGWRPATVNGTAVLAAPAPVDRGRALYVNGRRAPRPRFPVDGLLRIAEVDGLDPTAGFVQTLFDGSDRFGFADGDLPELAEPRQVEAVVPHYWVQERMPISSIDRDRRQIVSDRRSIFALRDDAVRDYARYYLDNVFETFGQRPGEWYLDGTGQHVGTDSPTILYHPRPGESTDDLDVVMPVLDVFVRLLGSGAEPVREVSLDSLTFCHADFAEVPPARPPFGVREDPVLPTDVDFAADVQAASTVPAALQFDGARSCALTDCTIRQVGGYGLSLGPGSRGNLIKRSTFTDLGAGAIRSGGAIDASSADFSSGNEVSDNEISAGGRVYPSCVAVLFQHGARNVIAHNHIHDFFYTGISVGWVWDYAESPSAHNLIIGNHIHDLGQRVLNDMGGVYLLGIAPGTVVRGNHIHHIRCANYGGWGIYTDEGSSHVVIESNLVHDVSSHAYHHHYGREMIIRNNIFAFGGLGQVSITRPEPTVSFTLERNILLGDGAPGYRGGPGEREVENYRITSDLNLFWDLAPAADAIRAGNGDDGADPAWEALGHDRHSLTADPLFADAAGRDFRVADNSPAHGLGITVPDLSDAGPRPRRAEPDDTDRRTR